MRVNVVARSRPVPGLPLITAIGNSDLVPYLREALALAIDSVDRSELPLTSMAGIVPASPEDYGVLLDPPFGNFHLA